MEFIQIYLCARVFCGGVRTEKERKMKQAEDDENADTDCVDVGLRLKGREVTERAVTKAPCCLLGSALGLVRERRRWSTLIRNTTWGYNGILHIETIASQYLA